MLFYVEVQVSKGQKMIDDKVVILCGTLGMCFRYYIDPDHISLEGKRYLQIVNDFNFGKWDTVYRSLSNLQYFFRIDILEDMVS